MIIQIALGILLAYLIVIAASYFIIHIEKILHAFLSVVFILACLSPVAMVLQEPGSLGGTIFLGFYTATALVYYNRYELRSFIKNQWAKTA